MEFQVSVQIEGEDVLAGTLYANVRRGVESATFRYDVAYARDARAFALAPDMPITEGALHTQGEPLFRVFEDCLPDRCEPNARQW